MMEVVFTHLDEKRMEEWLDICARCFTKTPKEYFSYVYIHDPTFNVSDILVAKNGEGIIGGVRLLQRIIYINGKEVTVGGLTDLCVLPEFRMKRVFTTLMAHAFEYLESNGLPFTLVFTHLRANKYADVLRMYKIPMDYVTIACPTCPMQEGYKIRELEYPNDSHAIKELYNGFAPGYNCTVKRNEVYWDKWLADKMRYAYVLELKDELIAYLVYGLNTRHAATEPVWKIIEYISEPKYLSVLPAMINDISDKRHLPKTLRIPLPLWKGSYESIETVEDMMIRVNNIECDNNNASMVIDIATPFFSELDRF